MVEAWTKFVLPLLERQGDYLEGVYDHEGKKTIMNKRINLNLHTLGKSEKREAILTHPFFHWLIRLSVVTDYSTLIWLTWLKYLLVSLGPTQCAEIQKDPFSLLLDLLFLRFWFLLNIGERWVHKGKDSKIYQYFWNKFLDSRKCLTLTIH